MNLIQCPNGHFYDRDLHETCPYCENQQSVVEFTGQDFLGDMELTQLPDPAQVYGFGEEEIVTQAAGPLSLSHRVTGWLVCTEGPDPSRIGVSREIYPQLNPIAEGLREGSIHGDAHCIAYDPKGNRFYLVPGQDDEVCCNGVPTEKPTGLNAYDVLSIGPWQYLFLPLCSDRFTWKE